MGNCNGLLDFLLLYIGGDLALEGLNHGGDIYPFCAIKHLIHYRSGYPHEKRRRRMKTLGILMKKGSEKDRIWRGGNHKS